MLVIAILLAASASAPDRAADTDPIARSNLGEIQCYRPDPANKTCESIASYKRTGPGTYITTSLLPLGDGVTLEMRSSAVVKDGAVCGSISRKNILAGRLRSGNQPIAHEKAKPLLEHLADQVKPVFGKELCTRYESSGSDLIAKNSLDGVDQPDKDTIVKWMAPAEGYTVAATQQMYRTGISTATPQLQAKWMQWARCGMTNGGYGFSWMDSPYGIFILAVAPGSRAEAAGLKTGQQVVEIGGQSTKRMSREQFSALIHSRPAAGFNLKLDDASEIRLPPL
jgi:hypothetical protein